MTEPQVPAPSQATHEQPALDPALDQALDWLIRLECPSAQDCVDFDAWLAAAPEHAVAYAKAAALWQGEPVRQVALQLQGRGTPAPPARVPRAGGRVLRGGRGLRRGWKSLAAAAVVVLGVSSYCDLPLRLEADQFTQVGERQRIELRDGSRVLLNTHSALASSFTTDHHLTRLLQGEAFFEVDSRSGPPLEVQAGPLLASVRDTAFAVSYRDGEAQVKVQRGNVDLLDNRAEPLRLSAGDSVRIDPQGFTRRERIDPAVDLAWVQGRLVFQNRPLGQVLDEVRRYYPGWILNRNAGLDAIKVTGNYRLDQPLDAVRALAHVASARVEEYPGVVILN